MMKLGIVLTLLLSSTLLIARLTSSDKQEFRSVNQIVNGGFENGTAKWKKVGSGTFTLESSDVAEGNVSGVFDSSASSEYLETQIFPIEKGLQLQDCSLNFQYKGGDNTYTVQVLDESDEVVISTQLSAQASYTEEKLDFSCGDQHKVRVLANGDGALLKLDSMFIGNALGGSLAEDFLASFNNFISENKVEVAHTDIQNRAKVHQGLDIHFGIERIRFDSIIKARGESGPQGETVYKLAEEDDGRVRLVGNWRASLGFSPYNFGEAFVSDVGDYLEVTFYGTGMNVLTVGALVTTVSPTVEVYVDGVLTNPDIFPDQSNVLQNISTRANVVTSVAKNLPLGWHTVKMKLLAHGDTRFDPQGIEIINGQEPDGVELVTNGTFDTDLTGWTQSNVGTGTDTQENGFLKLSNPSSGNYGRVYQALTLNENDTYVLSLDEVNDLGDIRACVSTSTDCNSGNAVEITGSTSRAVFRATSNSMNVVVLVNSSGTAQDRYYDNISVQKVSGYTYGSELALNYDFSLGDQDWVAENAGSGTSVISGGQLAITGGSGGNFGRRYQVIDVDPSKFYEVTTDIASGGSNSGLYVRDGEGISGTSLVIFQQVGDGVHKRLVRPTSNKLSLVASLWVEGGGTVTYNSISIKESTPDSLQMKVTQGTAVIAGKTVDVAEQDSDYNAGVTGTKGAKVVKFIDSTGSVGQLVQEVKSQFMTDYELDGNELVVNGDFKDGSSNWTSETLGSATITFSNNSVNINRVGGNLAFIKQQITGLEIGKPHSLNRLLKSGDSKIIITLWENEPSISDLNSDAEILLDSPNYDKIENVFIPTASSMWVRLTPTNTDYNITVNNISVQKVVTGPNLISNGTFDTNLDGWVNVVSNGGTTVVSNGELTITRPNTGGSQDWERVYQVFDTKIGAKYIVSANVSGSSGGIGAINASNTINYTSNDGSNAGNFIGIVDGVGNVSFSFEAQESRTALSVHPSAAISTSTFDNIAVYELSTDIHSNEQVARIIHFREFGADRSDDFSSITAGSTGTSDRAFTLNDGTTTLVCDDCRVLDYPGFGYGLTTGSNNDTVTLTFVGTGLDIEFSNSDNVRAIDVFVDGALSHYFEGVTRGKRGVVSIASNLPYGTHTVSIKTVTSGLSMPVIHDFIIYEPKKPEVPSNVLELAEYNVMADFVSNATTTNWATSTNDSGISQGSLRKCNTREIMYFNSPSLGFQNTYPCGYNSHLTSDSLKYSFFGTGVTMLTATRSSLNGFTVKIDGSLYSDGVMPITGGTGTNGVYPCSGNQDCTLEITGLPLGLHEIEIISGSNNYFHGFDVISPTYSSDIQNGSNSMKKSKIFSPIKKSDEGKVKTALIYDSDSNNIIYSQNIMHLREHSTTDFRMLFDKRCKDVPSMQVNVETDKQKNVRGYNSSFSDFDYYYYGATITLQSAGGIVSFTADCELE